MLAALEVAAHGLRDLMPSDTDDSSIYAKLKGTNSVFITHDKRQRTREIEATALRDSGVTVLFLGAFWARMSYWKRAAWLVDRWEKISGFAEGTALGTTAEVSQNGRCIPFNLR